ncbi:MAG: hypothetical protein IPK63_04410 [Candidatus Competibacteraceae bacterium]|nr:hypothetical protein [Candidatus Competibacteraceae bacterium]
MSSFHALKIRRRELLEELEKIDEAMTEVAGVLEGVTEPVPEEFIEYYEHRSWLQRQHAGTVVILNETERALLEFGVDDWD